MSFQAKRISRSYRQMINAAPERVFPLICPVREAEWLENWNYKMIYSETGLAEPGAVFSTSSEGEQDTIWIITKHDAVKREVEFTRVTPGSRTCVLQVWIRQKDEHSSFVDLTYTFTATSDAGNTFVDIYTEETFLRNVRRWEDSVNHFLATGKILKAS